MDQADEFEMKPLTPGLGFQKRQINLKEHMAKAGTSTNRIRKSLPEKPADELLGGTGGRSTQEIIAELHEALKSPSQNSKKGSAVQLSEILPRDRRDLPRPEIPPTNTPIENISFQIPNERIEDKAGTRRGAHDNPTSPLKPVSVSFASMLLDSAVVLALSLLFLVSLVLVTGVNLTAVVSSSQTEFATQLSMIVLYVAVFEMYVIILRSFFGRTVGEWTFELQMGRDEQIAKANYPALVLWRTLLSLLTGILLLPILSLLFGRDLAATFTGLQLYKKES